MTITHRGAPPKLTDDQLQETVDAIAAHGSIAAAARVLKMAHSCVSVRSRQAAERGIEAKCQRLLRGEDSAPGPGLALKGTSTLYGEDGTVKLQWVKTDKDRRSSGDPARRARSDVRRN